MLDFFKYVTGGTHVPADHAHASQHDIAAFWQVEAGVVDKLHIYHVLGLFFNRDKLMGLGFEQFDYITLIYFIFGLGIILIAAFAFLFQRE